MSSTTHRAVTLAELDPRVSDLLAARGSSPPVASGTPTTLASGAGATWCVNRVDGGYELRSRGGPGRTEAVVVRDTDLDLVQRVLIASLAESWWHTRPWRWPTLRFRAATATPEEWARLRAATVTELIAALDTVDGTGILTPAGRPIPEDLVTDAVYARAEPQRLYPFSGSIDPETVHLGIGDDRSHFTVVRHPVPPRYELIELRERSNHGSTVLRTDDPAELEGELLRRI